MDLYVPDRVAASPAVVVSLHYCGGSAANAHGWFQSYADTNGFLIIAPKSAGSCFDAGLGRSGERANIVKMVQYVVTMNNADPKKVFAAGPSSGACMTHALLASYPDVFAGGSSLAGVPAGAWTGGGAYGWSAPASTTAQQWGDKVRNADPGFAGAQASDSVLAGNGRHQSHLQPDVSGAARAVDERLRCDRRQRHEGKHQAGGGQQHLGADLVQGLLGIGRRGGKQRPQQRRLMT